MFYSDLNTAAPLFDAVATTYAGAPAAIVWTSTTGSGTTFRLGYISATGRLGSPATGLPSVAAGSDPVTTVLGLAWNPAWDGLSMSTPLCVMGATTAGPFYEFFNAGLLVVSGGNITATAVTNQRIALAYSGKSKFGDTIVRWAIDHVGPQGQAVRTGYVDTGDVQSVNSPILQHGLQTRAWTYNGDAYVTLGHPAKFFSYNAVVKLKAFDANVDGAGLPLACDSTVAARLCPGQSPGLPARGQLPSAVVSGTLVSIPLLYRIQLASSTGDKFGEVGIRLYTMNFKSSRAWQSTQLGRGLYIASACMQHYDGDRVAEADFHCAPDTTAGAGALATPGTGGSLTVSSTYSYKVVYEEIDGQGELHRGPVTVAATQSLTSSQNSFALGIVTYPMTSKRRVRIGIFRCLANQEGTDDSIPFYRVSSTDPLATGANGYVLNDPSQLFVTFVDQMSDAVLQTQEPLYTNGGVLSNDPPTFGGGVIQTAGGRLFWDDPDDPNVIRYSQPIDDETAVEMPSPLSMRLDRYGGKLRAIGVMDDAVFGFKDTAIYVAVGSGPDISGGTANGSFSPPALLTSDVGCKAPGSICQTPIGITFQSSKGIMLMGRDRQVVDIGAPVYKYNSQTVVKATLLPDRRQILFLTNAGRTLLYDYEHQQWSTYTNHEGLDAVVVGNTYYYLRTDGRVFQETPGLYRDDNAHIPMVIETAWIKMAGYLQGWQRVLWVYWLGAYLSPHTLRMRYRLNYAEGYSAPIDMDVDTNYNPSLYGAGVYGAGAYGGSGGSNTVYQRRKHLNKPCQAISFRVEDVEATDNYGASFQLSELLIVGGVIERKFQPGSTRS